MCMNLDASKNFLARYRPTSQPTAKPQPILSIPAMRYGLLDLGTGLRRWEVAWSSLDLMGNHFTSYSRTQVAPRLHTGIEMLTTTNPSRTWSIAPCRHLVLEGISSVLIEAKIRPVEFVSILDSVLCTIEWNQFLWVIFTLGKYVQGYYDGCLIIQTRHCGTIEEIQLFLHAD